MAIDSELHRRSRDHGIESQGYLCLLDGNMRISSYSEIALVTR